MLSYVDSKDPNAPKKNLSAYMFFSKDAREEVKSENPEAKFGDIGKLIGQSTSIRLVNLRAVLTIACRMGCSFRRGMLCCSFADAC